MTNRPGFIAGLLNAGGPNIWTRQYWKTGCERAEMPSMRRLDACHSLINSANEFAYSIGFQ
jgi:hypothetical protein